MPKTMVNIMEPHWNKDVKYRNKIMAVKLNKKEENEMVQVAYSEYLNKFIKPKDKLYLPQSEIRRSLVPLKTNLGEVVLTPSKFRQTLNPQSLSLNFRLSEKDHIAKDPLSIALDERRTLNATKIISTIIFISTRDLRGFDVSGYIDFEQSLRRFRNGDSTTHQWKDILAGHRRLRPNSQDLSFIAWKAGKVSYNESDNFKVIPDPLKGLCFKYKGDGSMICIEKKITDEHRSCSYIESPKHGSVVIYDHRIRRKL